MPFGHVPVLEVDGKMLSQSSAISRYLARQVGLNGQNEWEDALVDMYADAVKDLMMRKTSWGKKCRSRLMCELCN